MFTGIITDIGEVTAREARDDTRFTIRTRHDLTNTPIGASIACSGVCLTVIEKDTHTFAVDVSQESLDCTNLADWEKGTQLNLEMSLKLGDELGGHLVSGHVDGVGTIISVRPEGASHRVEIEAPRDLAKYIATKGSVALDGVSLTVNEVDGQRFGVNIIPHTWEVTTLGDWHAGKGVHIEVDRLARYVERMMNAHNR